jgi:hypothetical protein
MPTETAPTPALPDLSPVCGKPVIARFDGGTPSSDGSIVALREIEARHDTANRLAACVAVPRAHGPVIHSMPDILRLVLDRLPRLVI